MIDKIKKRLPIAEIVSRLNLTTIKKGNRLWVSSIFRNEKTPSMLLDIDKNTYYDFGNGEHGDVIDLYMNFYRIEKRDAIQELKKLTGLDQGVIFPRKVPEKPVEEKVASLNDCLSEGEKHLIACKYPMKQVKLFRIKHNSEVFEEFYYYCIAKSCNFAAYDYLLGNRKLSWESINKFRIFTFRDYEGVSSHLKNKFKLDKLQRSGMFNERGNMIFFKHRIIIPYLHEGRIVYLRGRYFDESNSPDSPGMKYLGLKNDLLAVNSPKRFYNMDVINTLASGEKLYLTEGEFDAIAVTQLRFKAVGIPGAGNIPDEEKFRRLAPFLLVYAGDNDPAGRTLLTGDYIDSQGNKKHKENNLKQICEKLGIKLYLKNLPTKDVNDFLLTED